MARRKKQNEDQPQENQENADDTFGLPEIEYEPLKRDTPVDEQKSEESSEVLSEPPAYTPDEPVSEIKEDEEEQEPPKEEFVEDNQFYEPSYSYSYQEEKPAIWPKVLLVLLLVAVAGGAVWYFMKYRPEQLRAEAQLQRDRLAAQEKQQKEAAARLEEQRRLEEEQKKAAAATTTVEAPPAGTIETLSSRQGRYFVVVASSIDGDLIMDYAKKLSAKGVTSHIIPPYGKTKFHRLAVADGDTYANAQATADGMKGGEYGDKIWVIKY
jgi:hypothetical protein